MRPLNLSSRCSSFTSLAIRRLARIRSSTFSDRDFYKGIERAAQIVGIGYKWSITLN